MDPPVRPTPRLLWQAVSAGDHDVVRLLLAHGADPLHEDRKGRPVLASARGAEIRALLEQASAGR